VILMHVALITCTSDEASMNIRKALLNLYKWEQKGDVFTRKAGNHTVDLYLFDKLSIYLEHIDDEIDCDIVVFCTKHQAKSGIPSLSVHSPGNFSDPGYGGEKHVLSPCPTELLYHCYHALFELQKESGLPHEVVYEATHHGPATKKPTMFIEIGSELKFWQEPTAGDIIAKAVFAGIDKLETSKLPSIIGIGGLHTCPSFNKISQRKQAMPGHICPGYMLENLTPELLIQMIEKTAPRPSAIVLDWKGLGPHKQHIRDIIEKSKTNIEIKRTKEYSN